MQAERRGRGVFSRRIRYALIWFLLAPFFALPLLFLALFMFSDLHDGFVPFPELPFQAKIQDNSAKDGERLFSDAGISRVCVVPQTTDIRSYHRQFDRPYHTYALEIYVVSRGANDEAFYADPNLMRSAFGKCTDEPQKLMAKRVFGKVDMWEIVLDDQETDLR